MVNAAEIHLPVTLMRSELTPTQQSEHLAKRKAIGGASR